MNAVDFRLFYSQVLKKFDLGFAVTEILNRIMAGSDRSDDYEEVLKHDEFLTRIVCTTATASLKTSSVKSLSHGVVLVGQQRVRNMVLGHGIARLFSDSADKDFMDFESAEKNIKYALLAEDQAKKIGNEYVGIAFASGYIFDIFSSWILSNPQFADLHSLLTDVWEHSLKAGCIAWSISTQENILISHRKIIFAAALLHDIGRLGLALLDPVTYRECLKKIGFLRPQNGNDDAYEAQIEKEFFDLGHPEVGSAIIFQSKFLRELEMEIDFHHDRTLLQMRNPDAFLGGVVLNISDRLSSLVTNNRCFSASDVAPIIRIHSAYFPLNSQDLVTLVAKIRSKRWI
jgi:HD-like signal output (HDOD) protein